MRKYKYIAWSYSTSVNAERFGFAGGCWTVCVEDCRRPEKVKAMAGFAEKEEAREYAAKLPEPWSSFTK